MRKLFSTLFFLSVLGLNAQTVKSNSSDFSDIFQDSTLRVDYTFTGTHNSQEIALDELHIGKGWAGRRVNLTTLPLEGNGQIIMKDSKCGKVIYKTSFSTLFQEWQTSEEATQVRKSFENVFQLPLPRQDANVEVVLFNTYRKPICKFEHQIKIDDILIRLYPVSLPIPTNMCTKAETLQIVLMSRSLLKVIQLQSKQLFMLMHNEQQMKYSNTKPFSDYKDYFNFCGGCCTKQRKWC